MMTIKLPLVIVIALVSALAGGAISYVFIPATDPDVKALLERQVELAEQEAAARQEAIERAQRALSADPENYPTSGGREMEIRRPGQ
jgi:hypothetical protein